VDNYVHNVVFYPQNDILECEERDIHTVILEFYVSFPQKMMEKRYKLINFAAEKEIVDKVLRLLIINE
jgi:hypothetical protein